MQLDLVFLEFYHAACNVNSKASFDADKKQSKV